MLSAAPEWLSRVKKILKTGLSWKRLLAFKGQNQEIADFQGQSFWTSSTDVRKLLNLLETRIKVDAGTLEARREDVLRTRFEDARNREVDNPPI